MFLICLALFYAAMKRAPKSTRFSQRREMLMQYVLGCRPSAIGASIDELTGIFPHYWAAAKQEA